MNRPMKTLSTIVAVSAVIAAAAFIAARAGRPRSAPVTAGASAAGANRPALAIQSPPGAAPPNGAGGGPGAAPPPADARPTSPAPGATRAEAAERFARGERTVQANLGDAADATREALERGIADLEEALRLGFPERKAALVLIAEAYNQIGSGYAPPGTADDAAAFAHAAAAYREAVALDPSNVRLRLRYAGVLTDAAERRRQLEEAVRVAPDDGLAQYALGGELLEAGDTARGARHLVAAVERFTPSELEDYGWQAVASLRYAGLDAEAAEVEAVIQARKGGSR